MSVNWRMSVAIVWLVFAAACSDGPDGPVVASDLPQRNVMVIDEGIDLSATAFRGKVVASFTRECDGVPPVDGGTSPSFEDLKRELIAEYSTRDESCYLRPGIDAKKDPMAGVARYRDRWNAMLRRQKAANEVFSQSEWLQLEAALNLADEATSFHGTGTAGTVTHANPNVRLILVERRLGSAQETRDSFECIVQADVDTGAALALDPEVREAYLNAPASRYGEDFSNVIAQYGVGVVSMSFGGWPRAAIEQLQLAKGCSPIDLAGYFSAWGDLRGAWAAQHGDVATYVTVEAGGNEGQQVDSPRDREECDLISERRLLVGSYGPGEVRSAFSNYGACIPVFAPGEFVIVPYVRGWLTASSGTSFSTPLVARLISLTDFSPFDPAEARRRLLDQRNDAQNIPVQTFPADFFYAAYGTSTRSSALTAENLPKARNRSASGPRLDWNDEVLRPLRRVISRGRGSLPLTHHRSP